MKNNVQTNTTTTTQQETTTEVKTTPPQNFDVMLLNNPRVAFEAVEDVLAEVLHINRQRAMQIAMQAHNIGRSSVFMGPRDVAEQYQQTLTNYAREQHTDDTDGMGYDLMTFQLVPQENK